MRRIFNIGISSAYWIGFDGLVQISDANIEKPSNDVISYDCFFAKQSQFDTTENVNFSQILEMLLWYLSMKIISNKIMDLGTTYLVKQIRHTIP
jgi:hypothetical protein